MFNRHLLLLYTISGSMHTQPPEYGLTNHHICRASKRLLPLRKQTSTGVTLIVSSKRHIKGAAYGTELPKTWGQAAHRFRNTVPDALVHVGHPPMGQGYHMALATGISFPLEIVA